MVCSAPGASVSGTCGGPLAGVEVKLVDLPDMGYMSTDKPHPRGEICVKGPIVTKGYYKNPEATAAAFDSDGFFKTGDVGTWTDDGALRIIDRAKNLFKLSQGTCHVVILFLFLSLFVCCGFCCCFGSYCAWLCVMVF